MNQSNPDFELPEMPMPPEPPLEDEGLPTQYNALKWPAMQEFESQAEALEWAYYQVKAGGPRYYIHRLHEGTWEAVQDWLRAF